MSEFNDFKQLRKNYSSALQSNINKLQGRLKNLNNNIIKQLSGQKITMTKNPCEIKSLRSSCLLVDNNLASPTDRFENNQVFANYNRYSSLEVPQTKSNLKLSQSPDSFQNIFLKQSYLSNNHKDQHFKNKKKHTQSNIVKTTKKLEKNCFNSPLKTKNSQSLQFIKKKPEELNDKTLKRGMEKKKKLIQNDGQSKTKTSSRSPQKDKLKQKKIQTPAQKPKPPPINELFKKFIESKGSLSRTKSKSKSKSHSKSKSKSKSPDQNKKKQKGNRESGIHQPYHVTSQFSPSQELTKKQEYSPSLLRQARTLSKKKGKMKEISQQFQTHSPNKVSEVHTMRLKNLLKEKNPEKKTRAQIRTAESPLQQKQYQLQMPLIKSLEDQPPKDSKSSSIRINTQSHQKTEFENSLLFNLIHELQNLSEVQIQDLQHYLQILKVEKKDEELQTSLNDIGDSRKKSSHSKQKINVIETHQKMAQEEFPKKSYTSSPMSNNNSFNFRKEIITNFQIEDMCNQREKSIKLRVNTQMQAFQTLLQQQKISPRSFHHNKQLVQSWFARQAEQLIKFKNELQRIQKQSSSLLKKTEQDVLIVNDLKKDSMLVLAQLQQISFDQSEIKDESYLDQSDIQFSLPNSPKIVTPKTNFISQQGQQSISQQKQNYLTKSVKSHKKKEFEITNFAEEQFFINSQQKPLQVSPNNDTNQIKFNQSLQKQLEPQNMERVFKVDDATEKIIELLLDEASNSLNKIDYINQLANEQNQGILTNLGIINSFLNKICQMIIEYHAEDFIVLMNSPYGKDPVNRLRQLHNQDEIDNHQEQQPLYFIKQIYETQNQYEKIHNQAIHDAFNESLNTFRPYFYNEGQPFPWESNINNLTILYIDENNLNLILDKAKQKVLQWATNLCGLISDDISFISIKQLTYEQMIQLYQCQEQDTLNQMREERLQTCLEIEQQEEFRRWFQYDDKRAEVLMEITDFLFEDLIEQMVQELFLK